MRQRPPRERGARLVVGAVEEDDVQMRCTTVIAPVFAPGDAGSVESVVYDESRATWTVHVTGQKPVTCRILILATGYLSHPKRPDIPGLDSFAGKVIHTAEWDHQYDLAGKRAAVIGTGATAVQLLPEIAPKLAQMHVFQRTPIWVSPNRDRAIPEGTQDLFEKVPLTQKALRLVNSTLLELVMVTGALHNKQFPFLTKRWRGSARLTSGDRSKTRTSGGSSRRSTASVASGRRARRRGERVS